MLFHFCPWIENYNNRRPRSTIELGARTHTGCDHGLRHSAPSFREAYESDDLARTTNLRHTEGKPQCTLDACHCLSRKFAS